MKSSLAHEGAPAAVVDGDHETDVSVDLIVQHCSDVDLVPRGGRAGLLGAVSRP
jgi:hypothetical protein